MNKSFLVLFFKKEGLASCFPRVVQNDVDSQPAAWVPQYHSARAERGSLLIGSEVWAKKHTVSLTFAVRPARPKITLSADALAG
jgi:hypothetical protein